MVHDAGVRLGGVAGATPERTSALLTVIAARSRLEAMKERREREESEQMSALITRQPHRVAGGGPALRRVRRWCRMEYVPVACGLALLPWLAVLANSLPEAAVVSNWRMVWIGLDAAEAVALIATGLLTVRGHRLHPLTATAAATLLVVDAWFDTMTAAPGADQVAAAAMALGAELPLAVLCVVLAARGLGRTNAHAAPADHICGSCKETADFSLASAAGSSRPTWSSRDRG